MDDEDEQIIGKVAFCGVCDERTVHVDGVCRDHKVIRRRRPPAEARADGAPTPRRRPVPPPTRRYNRGSLVLLLVIGCIVATLGAIHIVHSSTLGYAWCRKASWTLNHTLIDLDHLADDHLDPTVLVALSKCHG